MIFIGLDGADWQHLDPLIAAGAMPHLARLVTEGRGGALTTIDPPLSPLVWTTMMTGVSPLEHGILDFARRNPATGAPEPIGSMDRKVPALWNVASVAKRRVAVLGLWATWPAEPVEGLLVADRFFAATSRQPAPPASVHPPERVAWAAAKRREVEASVTHEQLAAYLPGLTEADYLRAKSLAEPLADPVSGLERILVETRLTHALALDWLASEPTDLALVYFEGTDLVGHLFASYAPPRLPWIAEGDFARFSQVPERYFREVDRLLGDYLRLAQQRGAILLLASDHGFQWGSERPRVVASGEAATAGLWHRREGIWLAWGPGIAPAPREGAGVDRVAATLLALLGLPPGQGLAGPPLPGFAPGAAPPVDYRAGWRPPAADPGATTDPQALARLTALGYLGSRDVARLPAPTGDATRTPASFNNEGLIRRGEGDRAGARRAFEQALSLAPAYPSAAWNLSELLWTEGRETGRSDELLIQAVRAGLPLGAERVVARARAWREKGEAARSLRLLAGALDAGITDPALRLWRGRFRLEEQDCRGALTDFEQAAKELPRDPLAHASLGLARACLGDGAGARRAFVRSLELDPDQPEIESFLAGNS
ncbi:MAG TPA: alkaline phosphatase family protein [Thermoanaerobaculia bacterium]|nr:alkaline phosphatase family protein [Thermoanaerobaculia bacterium]